MKVLITGGSGNVGKSITRRLVNRGWDVTVLGAEAQADLAPEGLAGATYHQGDILDFDTVARLVAGCDGVIHLAAIANPMRFPPQKLFHVNVSGTYNVFEAAAQAGVKRIVQASSINAFGCFWGMVEIAPQYLPLDEAHPPYTTDVYSFSKQMVEEIGDYFWRREGISSVAMRFPGAMTAARLQDMNREEMRNKAVATLEELLSLSPARQSARLEEIRAWSDDYRSRKNMEYPAAQNGFAEADYTGDPLWQMYTFQRFNFFAYVHEEDAAQSMEKGLTAEYTGSHPLFINAAKNSLDYDSQTLARLFFPQSRIEGGALEGSNSLVSIRKAQELIGYAPEHTL